MGEFSAVQQRVVELKQEALDTINSGQLQPFLRGRVPCFDHYKRLTMSPKKAVSTAMYGFLACQKVLHTELFFTQALVVGAYLLGTHTNIRVILPSQYGKSFLAACAGLITAFYGQEVSVSANDTPLTKKIMSEVFNIVPNASLKLKHKLLTPPTDIDRLQRSLSKSKLGFVGGGALSAITLGGSFADSMRSNQAIGQSGNYIIDECALVPDANYTETGRSEFGLRTDGRPFVSLEISNPHLVNHFYRSMTQEPYAPTDLIIWGDIRLSIEEGKHLISELDPKAPPLESTKFFANDNACVKYLLCDFGATNDSDFFSADPVVDNQPVEPGTECVLGLDSANRGADAIMGALIALPDDNNPKLRVIDVHDFKTSTWVDFESPVLIAEAVAEYCQRNNVTSLVMDLGGGEYLYDRLGEAFARHKSQVGLKGVYFNSSVTKARVRPGFTGDDGKANAAELGVNKRAEMYIDLKQLMDTGGITFNQRCADLIKPELGATGPAIPSSNNRIQLQDKTKFVKKRLGHSPDALDSVVMGVHAYLLDTLGFFKMSALPLY